MLTLITRILSASVLTLAVSLSASAQTGAGTPPVTQSAPVNRPIPQKIILPDANSGAGVITTDRSQYAPGQAIKITFTVSNTNAKPVTYDFPTGQRFDITINDSKGAMLWQWSRGKLFAQSLGHVTITPGRKMAYSVVWNGRDAAGQRVPPGSYTINARLTNSTGQAITGSLLVNTDTDPNNMGTPTKTPADTGAIRQVTVTPQVTASKQITIGPANAGK